MRFPKRMCSLFLAAFFLAACTPVAPKVETAPRISTLGRILQNGELVVGTSGGMPPFTMVTRGGEIAGLDADLAKGMAEGMGVNLRVVRMPFSELLGALENGRVDMILSGMTITFERNLKVAFVGPYFVSGKAMLTKNETIARAEKPEAINKMQVRLAALKGSTSEAFVKRYIPDAELVAAPDHDAAVNMVLNDAVDGVVADYPFCVLALARHPGQGLISFIAPLTYEPIGIALPADAPHLLNWVQNYLNTTRNKGELNRLKTYWFGNASWLGDLP